MDYQLAFIIEDNEELCAIYASALNSLFTKVEQIWDGKTAMERLDETVPNVIILDMNLPLVSGHAVYKRIRSDARFDQVPILIVTANILAADTLKHELTEVDRLLVKPVSPKYLRQVIEGI
jgi:DNA-binding response OmpR family regulator